jgi:hypothetical protein
MPGKAKKNLLDNRSLHAFRVSKRLIYQTLVSDSLLVVKFQPVDIVEVILCLALRSRVVITGSKG